MNKVNKQNILSNAEKTLNREFFGITEEIKQIMTLISPWFLNPEFYDKPLIINLWGMTGTGKTHLVRRLVELLNHKDKYKEFELSNLSNPGLNKSYDLFAKLHDYDKENPILLFDEFQKSQTVNKKSLELKTEESHLRDLWSLLSDGILRKHIDFKTDFFSIAELLNNSENNSAHNKINSWIMPALEKHYPKKGFEFYKELKENPQKIFESYLEAKKKSNGLEERDLRKSLIFICGNMDEPFLKQNGMNIDPNFLSADELHEISKNITKNDIKESLLNLFRFEQVSRMGYNHIIFKSLNKESCLKYINKLLKDFSKKVKKEYNKDLKFSKNINEVLFLEGHIPSQGTRNLNSAFHNYINPILPNIISEKNKLINIDLDIKKGIIYVNKQKINTEFEKYNQMNSDQPSSDIKKIVAIHESGHLISGLFAFKKLPEKVFTKTSNKNILGFVYFKKDNTLPNRQSILSEIDYILGGYSAEKLFLYEDSLTSGSSSDLTKATALASNFVKRLGMGSHISVSSSKIKDAQSSHTSAYYEKLDDLEVEKILTESVKRNIKLFNKNKKFMKEVISLLSKNNSLTKKELKYILKKHKLRIC